MNIKLFEEGEIYFEKGQWKDAYDIFYKLFNEDKTNQNIYPFLSYCSVKLEKTEQLNYFLIYPFKNKLITEINYFETNISIPQWQDIEDTVRKNNIQVDNLVKLQFLYFTTKLDDRLGSILNFVPNSIDDEFWLSIFVYNIYFTFREITRFQNRNIPIYNMSYKEICSFYEKCISIYENYALTYYIKAYFSTPLPNGWIQLFEPVNKAIELNPNYIEAYILRARWYFEEEMYEECVIDKQKTLSLGVNKKSQAGIYCGLGDCFSNLSKYFDAIISYNRAIDLGCNEIVYFDRGLAKLNFKDYSGALNDFNEAINIEDISILILKFRGEAKLNLKDFYGAIGDLTVFLEDEPHDYEAYSLRSNCYKAIDEIELSDNDLKKAQELKEKYSYGDNEDFEDED